MNRKGISAFNLFNYTLFVLLGIMMMYPFWYILMYSLSGSEKAMVNNYYFIPNGFSLKTYMYIFAQKDIFVGYKNSVIMTVVGTVMNLILTIFTAYPFAFAKKLPGKNMIFYFMFATMFFNVGIIPNYLLIKSVGMVDSFWALIIPSVISVYYLLIMMKFFRGIPESLIESAKIDGFNDIAIMFKIVIPLSRAVIAALALFFAVWHWNEFYAGLIYINSDSKKILQVILYSMISEEGLGKSTGMTEQLATPQNLKMTAIIVTAVPILIVYPFLQKHFMQGLMIGSVKG